MLGVFVLCFVNGGFVVVFKVLENGSNDQKAASLAIDFLYGDR